MSLPPHEVLVDIYQRLPFLVIHLTTDGVVLHCNPETLRVTGYEEGELVGRNIWVLLFPGKLFAQVPRFISLLNPSPLLKDVPMTIRTKEGRERVIGFSRYVHTDLSQQADDYMPRTLICIGVDLTDRLLDWDRARLPEEQKNAPAGAGGHFGPHIGNAGSIDSEIVTPIAISPRPPGTTGPCPIEQVREGLARVETHMGCVCGAFGQEEMQTAKALAVALAEERERPRPDADAGALLGAMPGAMPGQGLAFELLVDSDDVHIAGCARSLGAIQARVDELLALYRPELG